jgi:uncharacterized membrane protein
MRQAEDLLESAGTAIAAFRDVGVARFLFALAFIVEGALALGTQDFLLGQEPVPQGVPWRQAMACLSGALMLLPGVGLLIPSWSRVSARLLTAYLSLWLLVLQLPRALLQPRNEGYWLGVGEVSTLIAGSWLICLALDGRANRSISIARVWFGLALVPIGLSHMVYFTGSHSVYFGGPSRLIPDYLPFRAFLTYSTGFAHVAAGLAIAVGFVPRLAATLEATMETLFTVVVWGTAIASAPVSRTSWASFFASTALSAAAWAVAGSYRNAPEGLHQRQRRTLSAGG